ncbi:MAG: NAD(P)/FAD-dependent oxidoreductase [Acidobacteriia bacterium]|nr:NAD(P)/FAD-dependent oxidoreductase [Terriglobia bacterium]
MNDDLGMRRRIRRRDFLNGIALAAGGAVGSQLAAGFETEHIAKTSPDYYPPVLTGMRGSHEGSFEVAHQVRDGAFWKQAGTPVDTGETYDLVVVGGGISGLAAAHFFRKAAGARARILILDNHDDFGGHAKRNEFHQTGRMRLGYGGTFSIESPAPYSAVAKGVIRELGIDVERLQPAIDRKLYPSLDLHPAVFFDRETFGADRLVPDPTRNAGTEDDQSSPASDSWQNFMESAPLAESVKRGIRAIYETKTDYFPGLSSADKKAKLARISYAQFLTEVARVDPQVVTYFQVRPHPLFGLGIDAVSAQDAWGLGLPGFSGMKLDPGPGPGMNRDCIPDKEAEKYFFHFPDGNASIARLLVRKLIPHAIPGHSLKDLLAARANYARLDAAHAGVRIRLNSTVIRVAHEGDPQSAKQVEIVYVKQGKLFRVRGAQCVLACWNMVIPYICAELPDKQREALAREAKVPIVYTNVLLRNWTSWKKLGVSSMYAPGSYHTHVNLDLAVSLGSYHAARRPDEPIVVHMMRTPCKPGMPSYDQHRAGRAELFQTSFETFERNIRDQLARSLGAGGFDPVRDIAAITVNRWPHGYAYEYNSLFDRFWLEGGEIPCVVARQPFGRLAIANADAGAYAYTDGAIDQAWRAIQELTGK